jgi:nucleoside-diphosphate-sugar epimerase
VRELAELVAELTATSAPVVYRELPLDDPKVRRPDITRARRMLGWEPRVPLPEGLRRTIEYFTRVLASTPGYSPAAPHHASA